MSLFIRHCTRVLSYSCFFALMVSLSACLGLVFTKRNPFEAIVSQTSNAVFDDGDTGVLTGRDSTGELNGESTNSTDRPSGHDSNTENYHTEILRSCQATLSERGRMPPSYRDYLLNTSYLIHSPPYPNWPPQLPGPCMALDVVLIPLQPPTFSVMVTSFNRARQVRQSLVQLLKLTHEPWELIWVNDGSTDNSVDVVMDGLERYIAGWKPCPYQDVDENMVWPDASNEPEHGDVGRECSLHNNSLVRARVVNIPKTGLLESFDNNLQMRMAHPETEFFVLFQDDMFMTMPGWNVLLASPLRTYGDMFSASMRCAHGYPQIAQLTGTKCKTPCGPQTHAWKLYVRDSGNRGPIIIRGWMAKAVGFMDEINTGLTPLGESDHELNLRAYYIGFNKTGGLGGAKWKSGFVPVPFTQYSCRSGSVGRSPSTPEERALNKQVKEWNARRTQHLGRPLEWSPSQTHDAERDLPPRSSHAPT